MVPSWKNKLRGAGARVDFLFFCFISFMRQLVLPFTMQRELPRETRQGLHKLLSLTKAFMWVQLSLTSCHCVVVYLYSTGELAIDSAFIKIPEKPEQLQHCHCHLNIDGFDPSITKHKLSTLTTIIPIQLNTTEKLIKRKGEKQNQLKYTGRIQNCIWTEYLAKSDDIMIISWKVQYFRYLVFAVYIY